MEIEREDKKINDGVNVEVTVEYNDTNSTSYMFNKGYVFETQH